MLDPESKSNLHSKYSDVSDSSLICPDGFSTIILTVCLDRDSERRRFLDYLLVLNAIGGPAEQCAQEHEHRAVWCISVYKMEPVSGQSGGMKITLVVVVASLLGQSRGTAS